MSTSIHVIVADITTLRVDVIVNAANNRLLGGGGVDGAIHRAAGPALRAACAALGGCATGAAKLTPGFDLAAGHIVHTVGPVWRAGDRRQADQLAACYENAVRLADSVDADSVAFPSISTGAYGYPIADAADIAATALSRALAATSIMTALICAYTFADAIEYRDALAGS